MAKSNIVYVIDDDLSARRGISRLLRVAGHEVQEFSSGDDFLAAAEPGMTGCILLDVRMPGISSEELYTELISRNISIPLIFVSADSAPEIRTRALKMKAAGFFRKPVDATALLDAIDWALSKN